MAIKCNNGPYVLVFKVDFNTTTIDYNGAISSYAK